MVYFLAALFVAWVIYDAARHRELMAEIDDLDRRVEEIEVWMGVVERVPVNSQWAAMVDELCEAQGDET